MALLLLGPLPHIQCHMQPSGLHRPGKYLRLHPLLCNRHAETKNNSNNNGPNERTDQSSRKKIQLSDEEIATLSGAEFKTLIIGVLSEFIEFSHKVKEEMKSKMKNTK